MGKKDVDVSLDSLQMHAGWGLAEQLIFESSAFFSSSLLTPGPSLDGWENTVELFLQERKKKKTEGD